MKAMLQELVASGTSAFDESAVRTANMTAAAAQRVDQGISAMSAAQSALSQHSAQHGTRLSSLITASSAAFAGDMSVVSGQRQTADSVLATVSGMVGTKRKYLDSTVTELCSHVDTAIQKGVAVVDTTSATASKVLSDVSNASQAMEATASAAMETFTSFMDQEGEALSSGMDSHFSAVSAHASTQSADLMALQKAGGIHQEAVQATAVQVTGATPRKVQPSSFEGPFKRTRSHSVIRGAAKSSLQPSEEGETISYEAAKQGIADCSARAAQCVEHCEMEISVMEAVEVPVVAAIAAVAAVAEVEADVSSRGRSSSVSTMSTSSSRLSKESATSESADLENDITENANPNITTSRSSRGASKGRGSSKIATLGRSTSTRNNIAAAHEPLAEL